MCVRAVGMRVRFPLRMTMPMLVRGPMLVTVSMPISLRYRMTTRIVLMAVSRRGIGGFRHAALLTNFCRLRRFVIVFIPTPRGMRSKPLY